MKKYLLILPAIICFLLGVYAVVVWTSYHFFRQSNAMPSTSKEMLPQSPIILPQKQLEQFTFPFPEDCKCKQLRSYQYLESHKSEIKKGMSKQKVEKLLGKPDCLSSLNDYYYCTDKVLWAVRVPFVIRFDKNQRVTEAVFVGIALD
jgi:hypothetical protein